MASHPGQPRIRVDSDGVRTLESRGTRRLGWLIAAAIALPVAATLVAIGMIRTSPRSVAAPRVATRVEGAAPVGDTAGPDAASPRHETAAPGAPSLAAVVAPAAPGGAREHVVPHRVERPKTGAAADDEKPNIDARDAIPALIAAGETGGITVFPLPGTKPIKRGVVVPDDFPLPEGYVRHYQTTDDGEQLPAILMFHPDYDFVNDRGEPIAVPADRVVPPDLAPPGLEPKMLDVPEKSHESRLP
jgi:hypothetical protein